MNHRQPPTVLSAAIAMVGVLVYVGCDREPEPAGGLTPTPARVQPPEPADDTADAGAVQFAGVTAEVPGHWISEQPASSMRAAQYRIPGSDDHSDVEVAVFAGIFGSNDENIARWVGQFASGDGTGVEPELEELDANGMSVTLVTLSGTYSGMSPRGAATEPQPDTRFIAAIVNGPDTILHIRMLGPNEAVEANRDAFVAFVKGLKPAQ